MLLECLKGWGPFKIDALGIITLLGAEEMNLAIGKLSPSPYIKYLPLLGAHTIASNSITKYIPGFAAHNITDRIKATDVAGWFARWLLAQKNLSPSTCIKITVSKRHRLNGAFICAEVIGLLIGCLATIAPLVVAVLMGDWYGSATYLSIVTSVTVRTVVVRENYKALDIEAEKIISSPMPSTMPDEVKTFWTLPDGNAVTILAPRGVVINCLLTVPRPRHPHLYNIMRGVGWVAFAVNIVTLGNASLLNQLLTIILLLIPTLLVATNFMIYDTHIGSRLQFQIMRPSEPEFRATALARLELNPEEEDSMVLWGLYPHRSNRIWWDRYETAKKAHGIGGFRYWDQVMAGKTDAHVSS
jgi:hypothetical protein